MGVIVSETEFAAVSEWMLHGNINQFVEGHQEANRFKLVGFCPISCNSHQLLTVETTRHPQLGDVAEGLIYMHDQGMIHGNLKGVRIPIAESDLSS